jgi:hypothetical protein
MVTTTCIMQSSAMCMYGHNHMHHQPPTCSTMITCKHGHGQGRIPFLEYGPRAQLHVVDLWTLHARLHLALSFPCVVAVLHKKGFGVSQGAEFKKIVFSVISPSKISPLLDCLINFIEKKIFNIVHNEIIIQRYQNIKIRRRKLASST